MKKHTFLTVVLITLFAAESNLFAQTNIFAQTTTPFDSSEINKLDQFFMQPYNKNIDKAGDILTVAALATPLALLATPNDQWLTEGIMYTEACLFAYGIEEIGKLCVDRTRPYMYFDNFPQDEYEDGDYLNSWPSAHTTMAFTGAGFTTYVFSQYFPDSPWRFAVAGGSYVLAASVAACRVYSGNHFVTDVLTGAAIGTLSGLVIPYVHTLAAKKMPETENVQVQASPFGLLIKFSF